MMKTQTNGRKGSPGTAAWLWLSIAAALLAIAGSIVALAVKSIYAGLTPVFLPQALAQDIANLALVAPLWLLLAALLLMGYRRRQFFLVRGQLDAPVEPVRWLGYSKPEPWTTPGITDAR